MKLPRTSFETIKKDIDTIDSYNSTPGYGTTRILFTDEELKAREYVKQRMVETGLTVREDGVGNIFATLAGTDPSLAPVWTGSHIDTVNNAGKFDGMAGVVAGIEALRAIRKSGIAHKRNLEVIVFTSEEPTRFGEWGIGSHALAGLLRREDTQRIVDGEGKTLESVLQNIGFDIDTFDTIARGPEDVHAFIELHIEQAPILDRKKIPIGIVEAIYGMTSLNIKISGIQGHAGGTPKYERVDPMMAFGEFCRHFESQIYGSDEPYLVGTIGKMSVTPNASNVIPKQVEFSIDLRDRHMNTKSEVLNSLKEHARVLEDKRKVSIEIDVITHEETVTCAPSIVAEIKKASEELRYENIPLVSGAFHDAAMVAQFAPIGMIFVPCKEGVSHSPDEWTEFEDIRKGADVLAQTLIKLADS